MSFSVAEPEPVGAGRSRGFLAGAGARVGADLKFDLEPEPINCIGSATAPFLASEKLNDLKRVIFHCIPVWYCTYF